MLKNLAAPIHLAAIDAGSNALRLVIARATSSNQIQQLETVRAPVRLGHNAFTRHVLDEETLGSAARTFREFRRVMDRYSVTGYRAVATSAAREARNRSTLIERIRRKSGIELEIISGSEEARLVRLAVQGAVAASLAPRLIFDLGGGSLELNFMRGAEVRRNIALPLGTVRLMETCGISGAISDQQTLLLRTRVMNMLRSAISSPPDLSADIAVACGGNAEALAQIAPAPRPHGLPALNIRVLRERLWQILALDVGARMRAFDLRQDRAEVIGIAAIVLTCIGQWLNLRGMLVPGVGVREGLLRDLVAAQFSAPQVSADESKRARVLLAGAEWFARRLDYDARHAERVRHTAVSLFDQLRPLHGLDYELRLILEMAAVLHDAGCFINRQGHHRHGDYLIRNAEIPGLRGWRRDMVACLVRYHNSKSDPHPDHKLYHALDSTRRAQVRVLTSLLRLAEKFESGNNQGILSVDVEVDGRDAIFRIGARNGAHVGLASIARRASLFEKEFGLRPVFRRASAREKIA